MASSKLPKICRLFTQYSGTIPENESTYLNETIPRTEQLESYGIDINSCTRGRREFPKIMFKGSDWGEMKCFLFASH